ncbi:hypothetical protein [Treponema sp. Marseille-Q4130]|uniref:hypothetical protein n=1 Tax=Treponema sp. Marseille-Q4130 TaxID=2766702 RepID=UPI0016528C1C|nr:hypothetical protein [Treponema sp. Marseille-Q4130]MBC6720748.1 hypothetical protein [Treponema sp. Marseille-Q4130]
MKKILFVLAALTAVGIGFTACSNGSSDNNGGGGIKPAAKTYKVGARLSCVVNAMVPGGVDFGTGLLKDASVTIDSSGNATMTAKFGKAEAMSGAAKTFIDPRNSKPGYYDAGGVKKDVIAYTISPEGDTATPPPTDPDHAAGVRYVTSMTFPVSEHKNVYYLWFYLNSDMMGVQFCDGSGSFTYNQPDKPTKYKGEFTIDWSTLTEQ